MSDVDIPKILKGNGVVGAGGAGFPSYAKLKREGIKYYIANGAECEPLLWVSKEIMRNYPIEILKAISTVKEYINADSCVVALKGKYTNIIDIFKKNVTEWEGISVFELGDFFPAGDEQVLVYEVTNRIVPEAGIPLEVGAVVNNIETLLNIYFAIFENKPVTDKYITIGGNVEKPITIKVPIGAKIGWILDYLNIAYEDKIIIEGGPMMGKPISSDGVITKTTGGLLLFPPKHKAVKTLALDMDKIYRMARIACIQCRYCTDQCPRYLLGHELKPSEIMRYIAYKISDKEITTALLCCECGICEVYSCPQGLSPRRVNQAIKSELQKNGIKYVDRKEVYEVRDTRDYRRIPMDRLKAKLNINEYDRIAPLNDKLTLSPPEVRILLKQHIGIAATPIVNIGDNVSRGELIAEVDDNKLGCNVHSSINGIVKEITNEYIVVKGGE